MINFKSNRYLVITVLSALLTLTAIGARGDDTATLLPNAIQYFMDANGKPLANGKVYMYTPSTTTPKTTWTTADKAVAQPQPFIPLGIAGKPASPIYGDGSYRQLVKDQFGNTIWDFNTASTGGGGSGPVTPSVGDGNIVGTILPWAGLTAPPNYVFAYGQTLVRADYPLYVSTVTIATNLICTSGLNVLSGISDTQNIKVGSAVEASCVPPGTTVTVVAANAVTVSANATVSTAVVGTFFPFGNGNGSTTINVPDFRAQVLMGRVNMGGTASSLITSTFFGVNPNGQGQNGGNQSRALVLGNLPAYTPAGVITNGAITSTFTGTPSQQALGPSGGTEGWAGGGTLAHTGTSGTIVSTQATSTFAGTPQGGTATSFATIQPSVALNYVIKVLPDVSTAVATGVASLGGMTGVIACGAGLTCAGQTISTVGPLAQTVNQVMVGAGTSAVSVPDIAICFTADNSGATDPRADMQACLDANKNVEFRPGSYPIATPLRPNNNQTIIMAAGTNISSSVKNGIIFYVQNKDNVTFINNGGTTTGKGIYCGNPTQAITANCPNTGGGTGYYVGQVDDVSYYLDGSTNVRILGAHTKNNAGLGIRITNTVGVYVGYPKLEGTNLYTTPILNAPPIYANYQAGISIDGTSDNIVIDTPDISGTTQGILQGDGPSTTTTQVISPNFHDIPGQHGWYGSKGGINITNWRCTNVSLACIKNQIQTALQDSTNFVATGGIANNVGGNCVEIGIVGGVALHNVQVSGVCSNAGRILAVGGAITRFSFDMIGNDSTGEGFILQGDGMKDGVVRVQSTRSALDGGLISATNSSNINLYPIIKEANTSNTGRLGIYIHTATLGLNIYDPSITDSGGLMVNGILNDIAGSTVKVLGSATITGASGTCVNTTGLITAWPIWRNLSCTGGNYTTSANITPLLTAPTNSGTLASTASSPLVLNASTGNITCPTCLAGSGAALTKTDDANVTLTLGGSPTTALVNAASITVGWAGQLAVSRGGTGLASGTSGGIPYFSSTTTMGSSAVLPLNQLMVGGGAGNPPVPLGTLGTTTTVLHGNAASSGAFSAVVSADMNITTTSCTNQFVSAISAGAVGTCATVSAAQIGSGAALTKTDDTNVTLTLGGAPTTSLLTASSLTLGWAGQLGLTRGGTAASLTASNGGIVYSGASALAILSGTATPRQMLQSGTSAAPAWSTTTWPATTTVNRLLWSSAANVISDLATANSSILVTDGSGVPSLSTTLPAHTVATSLTVPLVIGGSGTTGTQLSLQTTTGVGTTDAFAFKGGNNGATTFATLQTGSLNLQSGSTFSINGTSVLSGSTLGGGVTASSLTSLGTIASLTATTINAFTLGGNITGAGNSFNSSTTTNGNFSAANFRNISNGNAALTFFQLQNDTAGSGLVGVASTTYTSAVLQNRLFMQAASTNSGIVLDSGSANPVIVAINGTEQARVQASGGISIGTTTDPGVGGLQVNGQAFHPNATADTATLDSTACLATTGGKLLKGTGTLGICLGTSSARYKQDIVSMGAGLAEIVQLTPKNFFYKKGFGDDNKRLQYGFIAEEVVKVLPGVTTADIDGKPRSVDLLAMVPVLVNALKELKADNDNLRMDVQALQARVAGKPAKQ